MPNSRILVADDEPEMRETCRKILERKGYQVSLAADGSSALDLLRTGDFRILLVDLRMPDMDGISVLRTAKEMSPDTVVIIMTGHGTIDNAMEAVREGAFDYLLKPFTLSQLEVTVERGLNYWALVTQNRELKSQLRVTAPFCEVIATSDAMIHVLDLVRKVAPSDASVLVHGESGTGKEVIARCLHLASNRSEQPFIPIDCAALPENLLESELFGYERGAFTGATTSKRGLIESADGGTLFMDEIAEIPLTLQSKLLRLLQERKFRRVGGREISSSDFRLIAATNRDLAEMVKAHSFREDLFYRLNVVALELPPLRDRPADITPLANHFLRIYSDRSRKNLKGISHVAMMLLVRYHWPGNVRELGNAIEHAVALTEFNQITPLDLPKSILEAMHDQVEPARQSFREAKRKLIDDFEPRYLASLLGDTSGNISEAARRSGMKRSALQRLLTKYGIQRGETGD